MFNNYFFHSKNFLIIFIGYRVDADKKELLINFQNDEIEIK